MSNSIKELNDIIDKHNHWIMDNYPIQDDTWPSRRWKADMSDYADMSGYEFEETDLK